MKKKLVSILLSLSMCAAYATPLTSIAANKAAPSEEITVVETAAPNANNEKQFKWAGATTTTGSKLSVEYNDKIQLRGIGAFQVEGTSSGAIGKIEDLGNNLSSAKVTFEIPSKYASKAELKNSTYLVAKAVNTSVTVNVQVKSGSFIAEGTLNVSLKQKNIGFGEAKGNKYTTSGSATANFQEALGGEKKYANLPTVVKKYNGKKGLTFQVYSSAENKEVTLNPKTDFTAKAFISKEYTKEISKTVNKKPIKVYVKSESGVEASTTSEGAIENRVDIEITGKKKFKGTFVVTGCVVENLEPQRIVADNNNSISGKAIIFANDENSLTEGLYLNDNDDLGENFLSTVKFKAITNNIKVNAKKGTVSVKKVDGTDDSKNVAKVCITNKKNPNASTELIFTVTAKSITGDALNINTDKVIGTSEKPKYYKSLDAYTTKLSDKGKGLVLSYTKTVNDKEKTIKLKGGSNKDFTLVTTRCGVELNNEDGSGTGVFVTSDGTLNTSRVSKTVEYAIIGKGNYIGTTTGTWEIPLYTQVVSGTSAISDAVIKYGDAKEVIYNYISIDDAALNGTEGTIDAEVAKSLLKIKAASDNVKIDKEGKIVVKKINNQPGKITVSVKKNSNGAAAKKTLEFNLYHADIRDATVDDSAYKDKTFANATKAKAAVDKIKITYNNKKLKKNVDYTITDKNFDDNNEGDINGTFTIEGKGNFTEKITGISATLKYKYNPPKSNNDGD
jgi:hypothetical protein